MAHSSLTDIRCLCLDVDGVLTDGGIVLDDHGVETKRFNVRDGAGLTIWRRLGYHVAIITGREGMVVQHRARELQIEHVVQGSPDKAAALLELTQRMSVTPAQTAVLADDLPDLPMMREAGYPMAVADAVPEVREAAAYVTTACGGRGAVREVVEYIVKGQGRWEEALALFGG